MKKGPLARPFNELEAALPSSSLNVSADGRYTKALIRPPIPYFPSRKLG